MSEENVAAELAKDAAIHGRLPSITLKVPWDFPVKDFGEFLQARNLQMVWNGETQRVFEVMPRTSDRPPGRNLTEEDSKRGQQHAQIYE